MTAALTHVRLLVHDFPGCFRFYRDVLGLRPTFGTEGDGYADFDAGGEVSLALFDATEMAAALGLPGQAAGGDRCCLVLQVDDVDAVATELSRRGVALAAPPADRPAWGLRTVHLRDPDGNLVELYQDLAPQGAGA